MCTSAGDADIARKMHEPLSGTAPPCLTPLTTSTAKGSRAASDRHVPTAGGLTSPAVDQARFYFGLDPEPSIDDIEAIADNYPVFRITYETDDTHVTPEDD